MGAGVGRADGVHQRTCPLPPGPSNFRETADTTTSVTLDWNARTGITKYQLSGGGHSNSNIGSSVTSYTVPSLTACTTYTFSLRGFGNGVTYEAAWGAWATTSATTEGCPTIPDQAFEVS